MASNSVFDPVGISNSLDSIFNTVNSYYNSLDSMKSDVDAIQRYYNDIKGKVGQWLGNERYFDDYNPNNFDGPRRIVYDDMLAGIIGGDEISDYVTKFNNEYENFAAAAEDLDASLREAREKVDDKVNEQAKIEEGMAAAIGGVGSGIGSGVGGGYSGGDYSGGGSGLGRLLSSNPVQFNEKSASDTGLNNSDFFNKDRSIQSATAAAHDSIIDSLNKSKDERFNSTHNSNLTNHSSNGSNYSTRNGTHSGGGFSSSRGYSSVKGVTGADEKKGILSSVVASVDDIIRSSKKKKGLASSSIPILGSDKVTGSNVVPIASSIGAAGVTGIGLSSYFGKKKDEEDDDKKSDIDVANYDGNEQNLEDNTNLLKKSVVGLDDIDANMDVKAEKDSFATTDLIETDVANQVVDTEKREENLYI